MFNGENSSPILNNVTFSKNVAVLYQAGGMWNSGDPSLTNVTFSGNSANYLGGGMLTGGNPSLTNVTMSGNSANQDGGAIYNASSNNLIVKNSILWGNIAPNGAQIYNESGAAIVSNSIVEGGYESGTNIITADPLLGSLQNNGGYTQTMALGAGSSAIDTGDTTTCAVTDQRGVTRPYGAGCDMGAFELEYDLPIGTATTVSCTSPVTYGSSSTCTATVTRAFGGFTPGGSVSWATADSGVFSGNPCTLSGAGSSATCSVTYTPSTVGDGAHRVTATYNGDTNFSGSSGYQNITVNPKALAPGITASNKIYDGTTAATILTRTLTGVVGTDAVSLTGGTATFSNETIGNGKLVTGSGFSLTGAQAGNYHLSPVIATTTANISASGLTVSATGVDKVYDGNTSATVALTTNTLVGDVVTAAYASASFATASVGNGKAVSVNGISIGGVDAGNYGLLNTTASTTANITPKAVTVRADHKSKLVGEPDPDFTYAASGFVGSDTFTTAPTCSVPVAHDTPATYDIVCSGGVAGANYSLSYVSGTLTVNSPTCYALAINHTGQGADPAASPANSTGCPAGRYVAGASVNLSGAAPVSGWYIAGWSGTNNNASTDSTNTVTMPAGAHSAGVNYLDIAPTVLSVRRADPDNTSAASVGFRVTFSEAVTGVDTTAPFDDFALTTTGAIGGAAVTGVAGRGDQTTYTVTVNTGTGNGTIRLDVVDNGSIVDLAGNPLAGGFNEGEAYTVIKTANVRVQIGSNIMGNYPVAQGAQKRVEYNLDSGPVQVASTTGKPIIAALRDSWKDSSTSTWTSFVQMMGLPKEQLSDTYYFPSYNNRTLSGQLRFGNVDTIGTWVRVVIGSVERGRYYLDPSQQQRVEYDLDSGPVVIESETAGVKIIAALRDAWWDGTRWTSFSQMMGLPKEQLSDSYYFPSYNNVSLSGQLRFGNVDTVGTWVRVVIGGVERGRYYLDPSEQQRVEYALDSGPVVVESETAGVKIIAALRDAWYDGVSWTSFVQLMGLPKEQLADTYYLPSYNNVSLSGQLRFGNVDTVGTWVRVVIGGEERGRYFLDPSEQQRVEYDLDSGPVVIESETTGVQIIAALRDAWYDGARWTSFAQMMGLPALSDSYYFPSYNNVSLSGQLRFGVP
jgi:hypothetical protein